MTPEKRVAFYCGTGWCASEAYWISKAMGFPKISVYDGGWNGAVTRKIWWKYKAASQQTN
ncbi:MAG: rhodanese-like domain-containing protein [Anaerolineales bacterium]|nr:rhodanese-like domain-containing protein [Anaerolineales bacterium]